VGWGGFWVSFQRPILFMYLTSRPWVLLLSGGKPRLWAVSGWNYCDKICERLVLSCSYAGNLNGSFSNCMAATDATLDNNYRAGGEARFDNFSWFIFVSFFYYGGLSCSHSELIMKLWTVWTFGRFPCRGDQPCRKAATHTGQHKHMDTSMPHMGFEPTILVFYWAKTFHVSDGTDIMI
jgi:hypothetical protein